MSEISQLYKYDKYLDTSVDYIVNREIIEYDISSAGYNISIYYNILPQEVIDRLSRVSKKQQHVLIGILQTKDKVFKENLKQAFINIRREFFEANDITDSDILAIKKDAIFLTKYCKELKFGNVEFKSKNLYTSYLYINKKELYYDSSNRSIDVKGISDNLLPLHKDGMLDLFNEVFYMLEMSMIDECKKFIRFFSDMYKNRELNPEMYREFNVDSKFRLREYNYVLADLVNTVEDIDIGYNYIHYVIPLVSILL